MNIRDSKYLRFMRWFRRSGYRSEESAWRGFEYGYRLGYAAAKQRVQGKKSDGAT